MKFKEKEMIKKTKDEIRQMEKNYPGITESIWGFEFAVLPPCPHCGSEDTAQIQCGIIGRTIHIASATSRIKLLFNYDGKGQFHCNTCAERFG